MPEEMQVLAPRPDAQQADCGLPVAAGADVHTSTHQGASAATCLRPLPTAPEMCRGTDTEPEDFYEFLARSGAQPFRLHCEELTGQTGREERRRGSSGSRRFPGEESRRRGRGRPTQRDHDDGSRGRHRLASGR